MKTSEVQELQIVDLTRQGDGVGRLDGLAIFVPGVLPGERVRAEITEKKKSFGRGRLLEILEASPDRRAPFCKQNKECGGCGLSHLEYNAQLALKEKWVKDCLARIGGVDEALVEPIVGMEGEPFRYRNKAVMPVGRGPKGTCTVGYHQARSHQVTDCKTCLLQTEAADLLAEGLRQYVQESGCSVYDDKDGKGILRQLMVRTGFGTNQVMAMLHVTSAELPNAQFLADCLVDALEDTDFELVSIVLCVNKEKGPKGLQGGKCTVLAGMPVIQEQLCGMDWEISPLSFYQVNPVQMEKLYAAVDEFADVQPGEVVLDLYCGAGTIGLTLHKKADHVLGIESVKPAVLDANRNATINGAYNAEFLCGKAEEVLPAMFEQQRKAFDEQQAAAAEAAEETAFRPQLQFPSGFHAPADVVVLDPPRAGCEEALLAAAVQTEASRMVYVSCDPATLARDLKYLEEYGYKVVKARPYDLFPHTLHVECACLLVRQ